MHSILKSISPRMVHEGKDLTSRIVLVANRPWQQRSVLLSFGAIDITCSIVSATTIVRVTNWPIYRPLILSGFI